MGKSSELNDEFTTAMFDCWRVMLVAWQNSKSKDS